MNDNEAPSTSSNEVSDGQEIVTNILYICSASLSFLGSGIIVFKILRGRANNGCTTPYDRFIFGLSACDVLASVTFATYSFLYPNGSHVWAFGDTATCQAVGFMLQLSFSGIWYNGLLSYYFLLKILSQVQQKNHVQKFERWLHLTAAFWPITAILGLAFGWFGEDSDVCWISDEAIAWIVGGIPTLLVYLSIIINYTAIYEIVRKSLQSSEHMTLQKETTTLMILYVAAFVVCATPTFVKNVLELNFGYDTSDSKLYPLKVLNAIFLPLQGFFNVLIYIKPTYTRFRAEYPTKSMRFVLRQALFSTKAPNAHRYSHRRVANNVTYVDDVLITDITLGEATSMNPNEALSCQLGDPSNSSVSHTIHETNANEGLPETIQEDPPTEPDVRTLDGDI